jgi:hypothetical protein
MRIIKNLLFFFTAASALTISSCKKFVAVDPPKTQLISNTIFTSDATATAAVAGMYSNMIGSSTAFMTGRTMINGGLSSDELQNFSNVVEQTQIYGNAIIPSNGYMTSLWTETYLHIYRANAIIDGLNNSTGVSTALKKQLEGEAKFIRAYVHFYLVNCFGDVPYIATTDYRANSVVSRTPAADVYQKIIADLLDAQNSLADNYSYSNNERVRPNKWAATAMLARAYLYKHDWANAETQATAVINNSSLFSLVSNLNNVFLKNSTEAIWQLYPYPTSGFNTVEGLAMIATASLPPSSGASLTNNLLTAFEANDNRKTSWVGSQTIAGITYNYPNKFKIRTGTPVTEYYMILRLAEQYLIRAEARAQQNNLAGAVADLNVIRSRAGLPPLSASLTQAQTIAAVKQERRIELFCEWGHRWFDLKRTGDADAVLGPIKTGWSSTDALYPIPQAQILIDPNLVQNPGY